MPRKSRQSTAERNGQLDQAVTLLLQAQASLLQTQTSLLQTRTNAFEQITVLSARLDGVEREIREIHAILLEHTRLLQALPQAVREKIGFEPQP